MPLRDRISLTWRYGKAQLLIGAILSTREAETLNSKLKSFRALVRGVSDLPFFMYRVCKNYG